MSGEFSFEFKPETRAFNQDIRLFAYLIWLARKRQRATKPEAVGISLMHACKLIANVLLDLDAIRGHAPYQDLAGVPSVAEWTPYTFGAVVSFPPMIHDGRVLFWEYEEREGFWRISSHGGHHVVEADIDDMDVVNWVATDQISARLLVLADRLEEFYHEFTLDELNALATSRNAMTTRRAADRELYSWGRAYGRFLHEYQTWIQKAENTKDVRATLLSQVTLAKQMVKKISDYREVIPALRKRLQSQLKSRPKTIGDLVISWIGGEEDDAIAVRQTVARMIDSMSDLTRYSLVLGSVVDDWRDDKTPTMRDYVAGVEVLTERSNAMRREWMVRLEERPNPFPHRDLWSALQQLYQEVRQAKPLRTVHDSYEKDLTHLDVFDLPGEFGPID